MASEWWHRLPAAQRREYERSAAITRVALAPATDLTAAVVQVQRSLEADDRDATELAARRLVALLCTRLGVPPVSVRVSGIRPHDARGELHGLYTPNGGAGRDRITVWMRTARRRDVVAIKTFLRTLLHEVCHHLDFFALDLPHSFHTPGFYQRESSLYRILTRGTPLAAGRAGAPRVAERPTAPDGDLARKVEPDRDPRAPADEIARAARDIDRAARELGLAGLGDDGDTMSGIELLRATAAAIAARQRRHE
ncbi:MAG TPA: hypothetical protein VFD92_15990 [Candidatus Binatia bacterium]|nr:hypothetical protein [Candidatus Binatia bacterium]